MDLTSLGQLFSVHNTQIAHFRDLRLEDGLCSAGNALSKKRGSQLDFQPNAQRACSRCCSRVRSRERPSTRAKPQNHLERVPLTTLGADCGRGFLHGRGLDSPGLEAIPGSVLTGFVYEE